MKTLNSIPKGRADVLALASLAVAGALRHTEDVGLRHNTGAVLQAEYEGLVGAPGASSERVGREGGLLTATSSAASAWADLKAIQEAARQFATTALLVLRSRFGSRLNARWRAAGFTLRTLMLPYDTAPVLLELRNFYLRQRDAECGELQLTAARADELLAALQQKRHAVSAAEAQKLTARTIRNTALAALRRRLSFLRTELAQLLPPDDPRWYEFGFRRPVDGRLPEPVETMEVRTAEGHAEAAVAWENAPRATGYRVSWRVSQPGSEETIVGLTEGRAMTLRGLPVGVAVVVSVKARNRSGEAAGCERVAVVGRDGGGGGVSSYS